MPNTYETWAMKAILLVANYKGELGRIRFDEIKCITNKDGHWFDSFKDGDTPEDAWREELSALADSQ